MRINIRIIILYYPGTDKIYSYLESRGGQFDQTVFFGLQYLLNIFGRQSNNQREDRRSIGACYRRSLDGQMCFDRSKFEYILESMEAGYLLKLKRPGRYGSSCAKRFNDH
jgi:nicotinamide phosphoribosyltransferase